MRKILVGMMSLIYFATAQADIGNMFEQTLMPGPLSDAHHKLEKDCANCHRLFDKKAQSALCTDCHDHKNIKHDLENGKGFHGKSRKVKDKACRACHSEHEGRDKDLVSFDPKKFDHRETDFLLDHAHERIVCEKCHRNNKPFRVAPSKCFDCHQKKDVHKGKFGKRCEQCHVGKKWKDIEYDHDESRFKLRLAHREVKCKDCHSNKKYRYERRTCDVCHLKDDKHKRRFGVKCQDCHNEKDWKESSFDHSRDTKYDLIGKHRKAKCGSCHKNNPYIKKTTEICNDCHQKKDKHKGVFGAVCDDCHSEQRWKRIRFNHDDTRYVLKGSHQKAKCHACHLLNKRRDLRNAECVDCHRQVDVHQEALGTQCEACHVADAWIVVNKFDHDLSHFPLTGGHVDSLCEECHVDDRYRKTTPLKCEGCHFEPDVHQGLFGERCDSCHFAMDWQTWRFSHDTQTDYPLRGRHTQLSCKTCHKPEWGGLDPARECVACHALDDVHNGTFGANCGDCHNEKSFSGAQVKR